MPLVGSFTAPGDKSISHRLILFSLLARGQSRISGLADGADVMTSLELVRQLGVRADRDGDVLTLTGAGGELTPEAELDCGNSGTTMRLMMGLLAGRPGRYRLDGDESLRRRPMDRIAKPLRLMGAEVETTDGRCPVTIKGAALSGLKYELPVASAQLKSAVLLAGLQATGPVETVEPAPSRDHTERLIKDWGGTIAQTENGWRVEPSELTMPPAQTVPADASSAAFFLCAAALSPGSRVTAEKVLLNPTRTGFLNVLKRMGLDPIIETTGQRPEPMGRITVRHTPILTGTTVAPEEIPGLIDEVPVLALVATQAHGRTVFQGAGELRVKESDRLAVTAEQLNRLGADVTVKGDQLIVNGPTPLLPVDSLNSHGDHRQAMTLRLAAFLAGCDPVIDQEASAAVSYPGFATDLKRLSRND